MRAGLFMTGYSLGEALSLQNPEAPPGGPDLSGSRVVPPTEACVPVTAALALSHFTADAASDKHPIDTPSGPALNEINVPTTSVSGLPLGVLLKQTKKRPGPKS
ncbi:MAG TPA: hypothetical protein VNE62_01245 [Actinomycetota bacterium]|nr:hypothetical protein [Actinomycetota bacterium]